MNGTLLHRIRCFCESQGIPESTFGRMVVKDPRLVGDISKGRDLRPRTVARISQFMEARKVDSISVTDSQPREAENTRPSHSAGTCEYDADVHEPARGECPKQNHEIDRESEQRR